MGTKGQSSQNTATNQSQTYNPAGASYIQNALQQGQAAAQTPFSAPVAPVAGFSQDQQSAFNTVNNAQGMAQPYINQAQNYFSPQGAQSFMNPYAANVMAGMQDVFGQQASQNTGQLTQAAGGVGADRIAVGQAQLANQQGLAAGQTLSGLYNNSVQQAQSAGYGTAALGSQAQNAAISGAQAQLGTGGLQQQLSQAQLNAPYQQQLAQLAYPFQTAQFNAGITGALAPGLGGTTSGYGTSGGNATPAQPSMWSQLLGAGTAAAGIYGGLNSGSGGKGAGGSYAGNSSVGGAPLSGYSGVTPQNAQSGGRIGYDDGGSVSPYGLPSGFNDKPINIDQQSMVPDGKLQPIQAHIPQLNLTPPPQQSGSQQSGGLDWGNVASTALKVAGMFVKRGGRIEPQGENPFGFASGGDTTMEDRFAPVKDAIASGDFDPSGINSTTFAGQPAMAAANSGMVPMPRPRPSGGDTAMSFTGADDGTSSAFPYAPPGRAPAASGTKYNAPAPGADGVSISSQPAAAGHRDPGFAGSPWAALTAAGLGMMGGTSPFAGVNIGQGGMQGLKTLEAQREAAQKDTTIDQSAQRLSQEAQFHADAEKRADRPYHELTANEKATLDREKYVDAGSIMTADGLHPAVREAGGTKIIDAITGKPPQPTDQYQPKGGKSNAQQAAAIGDAIISGNQPPTLTGLYGQGPAVREYLQSKNFDHTKALLEYKGAEKQIASLNGPQMVRYVGLAKSVDSTIDEVNSLARQMKQGGVPMLNAFQLKRYIQSEGNSPKGQLATQYQTAVGTLKEEFANLANGGYAPTEPAWELANKQINGDYGVDQLGASLGEIQRLIRYRFQAIPNMTTLGPGSGNRYTGGQGAPAASGAKPDMQTRFQQLIASGMPEDKAYVKLHEEGYQ